MGANPHANGGLLLQDLQLPDFRDYAVEVPKPGAVDGRSDARAWATFLRDVMKLNMDAQELPHVRPGREQLQPLGKTCSKSTNRACDWRRSCRRRPPSPDGRVMEMLSEHQCQGWLEGYLLDRPARLLLLLRSLHPHHRLDVQPARQVAEVDARTSPGAGRSLR